jgi:hypothetical protein
MNKQERMRLRNKLIIFLDSIASGHLTENGDCIQCEVVGALSVVKVCAFLPAHPRDKLWIACLLDDWPKDVNYPNHWRGFDHWKQNFHPGDIKTADQMMVHIKQHFSRFHIAALQVQEN